MAGDPAAPPMTNKVFGITNIKSHIPLLLDIDKLNYDAWRELFSTHSNAFDVLDHVDDTYDDPKPKPTEPEWHKIDSPPIPNMKIKTAELFCASPASTAICTSMNQHAMGRRGSSGCHDDSTPKPINHRHHHHYYNRVSR